MPVFDVVYVRFSVQMFLWYSPERSTCQLCFVHLLRAPNCRSFNYRPIEH